MKVLLSIKPKFVEKIFEGIKKFEFRRTLFKNTDVNTIIVYASSPVQKVVGEFQINNIIYEELDELWKITHQHAGIDKDTFDNYFSNKTSGYAIEVKRLTKYENPISLKDHYNMNPPQSFAYIKENVINN